MFGLEDSVNLLEIVVRQGTFSGGDDFVVRVGSRCGDHFLGIADSYNFTPTAFYSMGF